MNRYFNQYLIKQQDLIQQRKIALDEQRAAALDFALQDDLSDAGMQTMAEKYGGLVDYPGGQNFINAVATFREDIKKAGNFYAALNKLVASMNESTSITRYLFDAVVVTGKDAMTSKSEVIQQIAKKILRKQSGNSWRVSRSGAIQGMNEISRRTSQWLVMINALASASDETFTPNQRQKLVNKIQYFVRKHFSVIEGDLREIANQTGQMLGAAQVAGAALGALDNLTLEHIGSKHFSTTTKVIYDEEMQRIIDNTNMQLSGNQNIGNNKYVTVKWPAVQPKNDSIVASFGVTFAGIQNKATQDISIRPAGKIANTIHVAHSSPLITILMRDLQLTSSKSIMSLIQIGGGHGSTDDSMAEELNATWLKLKEYVAYAGMITLLSGLYRELDNGNSDFVDFISINEDMVPMDVFLRSVISSIANDEEGAYVDIQGFPERKEMLAANRWLGQFGKPNRQKAIERSENAKNAGLGVLKSKITIRLKRVNLTKMALSAGGLLTKI